MKIGCVVDGNSYPGKKEEVNKTFSAVRTSAMNLMNGVLNQNYHVCFDTFSVYFVSCTDSGHICM
jgi:hypothetical protein